MNRTTSDSIALRPFAIADIMDVLAAGLRDFRAAPVYGLSVGLAAAGAGWLLVVLLVYFDLPYLVYPLAAGFALVAPFVVTLLYAVSLALERGEAPAWGRLLRAVWRAARRDLGWMALVTCFALFIWMDIAAALFFGFFGLRSLDLYELLEMIFTTPMGLLFLVIGNGVGALLAMAVFSFSVTSFPMLFERDVDFVTAMVTSVRGVAANPRAMCVWCLIIAFSIGLSLLTGLIGLVAVLPLLGHASWHLYRKALTPPLEGC